MKWLRPTRQYLCERKFIISPCQTRINHSKRGLTKIRKGRNLFKSVRIHSKKLTSVSIHLKKCVPINWLILLGQEILCVQASQLASLLPAHQSGLPNRKAKCNHHSLTKKGNVRNLTNGHISRLGHPRAILTPPTSCQPAGEREGKASLSSRRLLYPPPALPVSSHTHVSSLGSCCQNRDAGGHCQIQIIQLTQTALDMESAWNCLTEQNLRNKGEKKKILLKEKL
jgi:hypothetical protein